MPVKSAKRSAGKRKQNGKKVLKGQLSKTKQKYELESTPKEQITELDKEILTIKISESESKLNRKKHLCSYIEEEKSIYLTLYNEKQLLKSESMKLLNQTFEDFATEIFLLDQELNAMQHTYNNIVGKKDFCLAYREKVEKLRVLEADLEKNLLESEKCFKDLPELNKVFEEFENKANSEKEKFHTEKEKILKDFETCLIRIQNELTSKIDQAIKDNSLKTDLLPVPYKTLFLSGWLSSSWLEFAETFYERLMNQSSEIRKKCYDLMLASLHNQKHLKNFFSEDEILKLFQIKNGLDPKKSEGVEISPKKKRLVSASGYKHPKLNQLFLYLQIKILHQQNKVKSMRSEISDLEGAIKSLEVSGDTSHDKSYLVQIILKAGNILKEEL